MSDRELLELAAKGARLYVCTDLEYLGLKEWGEDLWVKEDKYGDYRSWNPLIDDGDAFRLAVKLRLTVICAANHTACDVPGTDCWVSVESTDSAAARRALTGAAALLA